MDVHGNRFTDAATARHFILAGNARLTLRSNKTGHHYTFRVRQSNDKQVWFVGILSDGDNEHGYVPLGIICRDQRFKLLRKTTFRENSPSFVAFRWAWSHLSVNSLPETVQVWHEGRCGRCGRALTHPESIESGFGPECINHV
jgi:hypothetical protein